MNKNIKIITVVFVGLFFSACSFTPELEIPPTQTPEHYTTKNIGGTESQTIQEYWWRDFGDSHLDSLIEEALKNNTDYAIALTKVNQARAALGIANADYFPHLNLDASGTQTISGTKSPFNPAYSLSAILSYELDLWGRVRESSKSAKASLLAIAANREIVKLAVISGVADAYFTLLSLEEQKKILESTVDAYQKSYEYRLKQYGVGGIEEIILEQSKVQLESAKANLFTIIRQRSEVMSSLSLLVGRTPKEIFADHFSMGNLLPNPPKAPLGLPSTLLQNRPDIKMAEETLKAANHSIGVARAAYFPTISLSLLGGMNANEIAHLLDNPALSATGRLSAPLIDFGKTGHQIDNAKARTQEALINYRATIARAFSEVKNALVARENAEKKLQAIQAQAHSQERVYQIAKFRFEAGYSSYLELLDAERNWLNVQLNLMSAKAEILSSSLNLYKALGGSFSASQMEKEVLE